MSIGSTLNGWGDHRDDVSALHVRDFGSWFSPVILRCRDQSLWCVGISSCSEWLSCCSHVMVGSHRIKRVGDGCSRMRGTTG